MLYFSIIADLGKTVWRWCSWHHWGELWRLFS